MVEGGIHKADKTELTECWRTAWRTPYIMKLALSAGIGGLLFGYDTGKKKRKINTQIFLLSCFIFVSLVAFVSFCLKGFIIIGVGVISGALLYIRDDFKSVDQKTWLQVPTHTLTLNSHLL